MARPARPERSRSARSSRQLSRFYHSINPDRVFGTHTVSDVQEENEELLVKLANRAVTEDDADVVILGGAPLAGLAEKVRDRISVPVVDQMAAAVKQAEAL